MTNYELYLLAVSAIVAVTTFAILRLLIVLPKKYNEHDQSSQTLSKPQFKSHIMILLGSGGHTGEMMRLLDQLDLPSYRRTWVVSSGDSFSAKKAAAFEKSHESRSDPDLNYNVITVKRARYVGQGSISSAFSSINSFFSCISAIRLYPDVIICNGPGTSVMICLTAFIFKYFCISSPRIIYIESLARVNSLSVSGKLILPIADRFLVQWPELKARYPKTEYYGLLV